MSAGSVLGRPDCPCGSGAAYDACCGPLIRGAVRASDPEQLMRSRYTAYAVGASGVDHLFRTWHPRTRPDDLAPDPEVTWTGLEILEATGDEVEFRAHHRRAGRPAVLHERSTFVLRGGRWVYLEASTSSTAS